MKKIYFRNLLKVLAVGGIAALLSALALALGGAAGWGFYVIQYASGYKAVVMFLAATLALAAALALLIVCGCWVMCKGRLSK